MDHGKIQGMHEITMELWCKSGVWQSAGMSISLHSVLSRRGGLKQFLGLRGKTIFYQTTSGYGETAPDMINISCQVRPGVVLLYATLKCVNKCANPLMADDSSATRWSYSALLILKVIGIGGESCTSMGHTCKT